MSPPHSHPPGTTLVDETQREAIPDLQVPARHISLDLTVSSLLIRSNATSSCRLSRLGIPPGEGCCPQTCLGELSTD